MGELKAQEADCTEFTLSTKRRLTLPEPYLIGLHSASPCVAVADALVGNDGKRYLIAYNAQWEAVDTIQAGADSASRPFLSIGECRAMVLNADVTFGSLTYTYCDFNRQVPYRRTSIQISLQLPGLFFENPMPTGVFDKRKNVYSQSVESVGLYPGGIVLVIRGPQPTKPPKPNTIETRIMLLMTVDSLGVLAPKSFSRLGIAHQHAWQKPKRTIPRIPLFNPELPQAADNAGVMISNNQVEFYLQGIGYVSHNIKTGATAKVPAPKGCFDPYMLKQQMAGIIYMLEYRQGKTMIEGMEGGYGRKSIYSLVGIYDRSTLSDKPRKLEITDAIMHTKPQMYWRGHWYGIDAEGKRVKL